MPKTVLITGATSGIGKATAEAFAKEGMNIVLCGRRGERLKALSEAFGKSTRVTTLNFDVRDRKALKEDDVLQLGKLEVRELFLC